MNNIVGIQVDVRENASSVAPRIVDQLAHIGEAGEEAGEKIQKAFDTTGMQSQFDRFAEKMDKVFGKERELKIKNLELRNQGMEKRLNEPGKGAGGGEGRGPDAMAPGHMVGRVGSGLASMGDSGNPLPAAGNVLEGVSGMAAKAGPVGMAVAAIGALAAGAGIVIDALSKQYEQFIPTLMDTSAAFGELKKGVSENSKTFAESLDAAAKSANKYGYSMEQGLEVFQGLGHGGLSRGTASPLADSIMAYGRGYGVNPGSLVGSAVLGSRYGQGNVLGMAGGGVQASGMGNGRYDEYLQAMSQTFEASLAKGVVKGFGEISSTMNFFSKLGETWKGQLGATRINQMSSAFEGATGLQKETDVLMYRAAQDVVNKQNGGKGGGSYLDVMKQMERGVTPDLFKAFGAQLKQTTGGNQVDMVEMMREAMGTNYTTAIDLVKSLDDLSAMSDKEIAALLKTAEPPKADSVEMQLLQAEAGLRTSIVELGESMMVAKKDLITEAGKVVDALGKFAGADAATRGGKLAAAATEEDKTSVIGGFQAAAMKAVRGLGNKNDILDPDELAAFEKMLPGIAGSSGKDFAKLYAGASRTPAVGSLSALQGGFGGDLNKLAPLGGLENQSRMGVNELVRLVGGYKGKNRGDLEGALTGMTQVQAGVIQQSGGFSALDMIAKKGTNGWTGQLTDQGAADLLKAIRELTAAINQPTSMTVTK